MHPILAPSVVPFFLTFHIFTLSGTHGFHPLDPLSPFELTQVQTLIKNSYQNVTFHYVGLDEPDKPKVLSWLSQNQPKDFLHNRVAFVMALIDSESHEITVDLSNNSILSDKVYKGNGYPMLNGEEQIASIGLPLKYAPFMASIITREYKLQSMSTILPKNPASMHLPGRLYADQAHRDDNLAKWTSAEASQFLEHNPVPKVKSPIPVKWINCSA
ncbi:hypothetical protein BUALT_Bualt14G0092000 [Buddleja alternifolia]|uniref:Amine oxidase n=1 Tax=Buddleja alternifolia TaxID=168488 RepID=A0AAV6WGE2_9LAMI|nr:hypothetical protein BUALT_Bualt14G0092000 [Buddleja alternifolia]